MRKSILKKMMVIVCVMAFFIMPFFIFSACSPPPPYRTYFIDSYGNFWALGGEDWHGGWDSEFVLKGENKKQLTGTHVLDNEGNLFRWNMREIWDGNTHSFGEVIPVLEDTKFTYINGNFAIDEDGNIVNISGRYVWDFDENGFSFHEFIVNGTMINAGETRFVKIASNDRGGFSGFSGFSLAIDTYGYLWTWGQNLFGQLGLGHSYEVLMPTRVTNERRFVDICIGSNHSLAVDEAGNLFSWGANNDGQLGFIRTWGGRNRNEYYPVHIVTDRQFKSVRANGDSSFAIDVNGNLFSWGSNSDDRLGCGEGGDLGWSFFGCFSGSNTVFRSEPKQVLENVSRVYGFFRHTLAVTNNGHVYTWGNNRTGQLGSGRQGDTNVPQRIPVSEVSTTLVDYDFFVASGFLRWRGTDHATYRVYVDNHDENPERFVQYARWIGSSWQRNYNFEVSLDEISLTEGYNTIRIVRRSSDRATTFISYWKIYLTVEEVDYDFFVADGFLRWNGQDINLSGEFYRAYIYCSDTSEVRFVGYPTWIFGQLEYNMEISLLYLRLNEGSNIIKITRRSSDAKSIYVSFWEVYLIREEPIDFEVLMFGSMEEVKDALGIGWHSLSVFNHRGVNVFNRFFNMVYEGMFFYDMREEMINNIPYGESTIRLVIFGSSLRWCYDYEILREISLIIHWDIYRHEDGRIELL
ncbi:MAG: hypothetical protein FWE22_07710 [Firmicutes bacterium]|nr:hypothetical protein [Bacillota bacterium]